METFKEEHLKIMFGITAQQFKDMDINEQLYLLYDDEEDDDVNIDYSNFEAGDEYDGNFIVLASDDEGAAALPDEAEEFETLWEAKSYAGSLAANNIGSEFLVYRLVSSVVKEPAIVKFTAH